MLRAPLSLAKMSYDAASGMVIYRSKMHLGLKRNFQLMPGAEWLELLCKHIPDRYEQLVRYVGWYSSRSRGTRKAKGATAAATTASGVTEVLSEYASRAKARGNGADAVINTSPQVILVPGRGAVGVIFFFGTQGKIKEGPK